MSRQVLKQFSSVKYLLFQKKKEIRFKYLLVFFCEKSTFPRKKEEIGLISYTCQCLECAYRKSYFLPRGMIMYDITIAITSEKRKKVFGWFKLDEIVTFTLLVLLKVYYLWMIYHIQQSLNYSFNLPL